MNHIYQLLLLLILPFLEPLSLSLDELPLSEEELLAFAAFFVGTGFANFAIAFGDEEDEEEDMPEDEESEDDSRFLAGFFFGSCFFFAYLLFGRLEEEELLEDEGFLYFFLADLFCRLLLRFLSYLAFDSF